MREIKFRAWSQKYNRLYGHGMYRVWEVSINEDGSLSGNVDETPIAGKESDGYIPRVYFDKNRKGGGLATQDDDVFILMQYTGLKDKNGKEIYEGDIYKDEENFLWEVIYCNGCFMIDCIDFPAERIPLFELVVKDRIECFEKAGNIYENKELLEVE